MKNFILCAEGFGKNKDYNRAILNGYSNGFVKSCSILANGEAFNAAVYDILPECTNISVGLSLNLTEGKALTRCQKLTDINNMFKFNYSKLSKIIKQDDILLNEIENEFRAQIEKIQNYTIIYHINSVDNVHIIPQILNLICKLALEYNIPYIRLPFEDIYYVPNIRYILNIKYLLNILSAIKINKLSKKAAKMLAKYKIKHNDYLLGIGYRNLMDNKTVEYGLKSIIDENDIIVELPINSCCYLRNKNDSRSKEFNLSQDKILENTIFRLGFEITNHKCILK